MYMNMMILKEKKEEIWTKWLLKLSAAYSNVIVYGPRMHWDF